jgi:hypothetical protein
MKFLKASNMNAETVNSSIMINHFTWFPFQVSTDCDSLTDVHWNKPLDFNHSQTTCYMLLLDVIPGT